MNRSINLKAFAAAIFVSFAGYPAATAQNTGTGGPLKQAELPQPVPLNVLRRVVVNGVDRMTSVGPEERNAFPSEGPKFYIAADLQEPGTTALNRFNNGPDHRDSTSNALPGYVLEGPNGAAWTRRSELPGLSPILEGFKGTTGDYALMRLGEDLPGYKTQTLQAYGFQRFGNDTESLLSLTKGGVTVESNRVYGGSLWHWKWDGVEFLNPVSPYDAVGAAILLFFDVGQGDRNAFEEGDGFGHGAPALSVQNQGNTQSSRTVPVADPTVIGVDPDHPLIWKNIVFAKDLDLDFNRMGPVARYATHLSLPSPIGAASLYHPILRVQPQFNRFFVYYAASDTLVEVTGLIPNACVDDSGHLVNLEVGGIIVSDSSATHALGVYGADIANGGSITDYVLKKYPCRADAIDYTRLDIIRNAPLPTGDSTYNAYLITETLDNVRQKMRQLFLAGVR